MMHFVVLCIYVFTPGLGGLVYSICGVFFVWIDWVIVSNLGAEIRTTGFLDKKRTSFHATVEGRKWSNGNQSWQTT